MTASSARWNGSNDRSAATMDTPATAAAGMMMAGHTKDLISVFEMRGLGAPRPP